MCRKSIFILLLIFPVFVQAQRPVHYSLFHPVPAGQLREMETDRPDVSESPITVDAGHFQYEADLVSMERHTSDAGKDRQTTINRGNLKWGLTSSTSLQIGVETLVLLRHTDKQDPTPQKAQGFGDVNLRIKQNIIGNNGGRFALAVLPYLKFPTATYTDTKYEGGIIVPLSLQLPHDWKLGGQVEIDRLQNEDDDQLHTEWLQSLTISHDIIEKLTGIVETYYTYDLDHHQLSNYLNAALQLEIAKDLKVDAGVNYGLQHEALKKYFVGLAFRL